MSLGRLIAVTVLDLVLALVIAFVGVFLYCWHIAPTPGVGLVHVGRALGLPLRDDSASARWGHQLEATFTAGPADDRAFTAWLGELPSVRQVSVRRKTLSPRAQGETQFV